MNARSDTLPISVETYLHLEEQATYKSEYVDGVMIAMAEASEEHGQIISNLILYLRPFADRGGCRVIPNNLRVRARATRYYYPDVVVVCGRLEYDQNDQPESDQRRKLRAITNPRIVIEVLSDSTEQRDLREKKLTYLQNASLDAVLFVAQDAVWVEHYYRNSAGRWEIAHYTELSDEIKVTGLRGPLTLGQIYQSVFDVEQTYDSFNP